MKLNNNSSLNIIKEKNIKNNTETIEFIPNIPMIIIQINYVIADF